MCLYICCKVFSKVSYLDSIGGVVRGTYIAEELWSLDPPLAGPPDRTIINLG